MTDEIRTIARETYQRTRIGRPHLPHEDSPEGQRKIDRLYDILAKHAALRARPALPRPIRRAEAVAALVEVGKETI